MIHFKEPDFVQLIQAIQSAVLGYTDLQKFSTTKLETAVAGAMSELRDSSADSRENTHFAFKSKTLIEAPLSQRPSVGASLIYGTQSSPLLRLIPVFHALKNRCSVVFLCSPDQHEKYEKLLSCLILKGVPEKSIILLSTQAPESLETLVTHPSLKAIYFEGRHYEGAFLKNLSLPVFQKRIRVHLGGRNPVIFTHDAPLEIIPDLFDLALNSSYLAEHSFNRWFVQDKNYSEFVKQLEPLVQKISQKPNQHSATFERVLQTQNSSLFKEKNWQLGAVNINADFNNCSPWQQQEVLGEVLTITRFKNTAEAVKFANTTSYASGAAVFTGSIEKSMEISQQLTMPHRFSQVVPDMGGLPLTLGLSETGFGQNIADKDFFVF
jgi:acyl-CoA reductase-like NAD-dependent aldehyde dehydrogenase